MTPSGAQSVSCHLVEELVSLLEAFVLEQRGQGSLQISGDPDKTRSCKCFLAATALLPIVLLQPDGVYGREGRLHDGALVPRHQVSWTVATQ